jgi:inosine-uridine nucleoside N-ribohydrolase
MKTICRFSKKIFLISVVTVCLPLTLLAAFNVHNWPPADGKPVPIIIDTDVADYDDIGAMAVLHALADAGKVRILAVGVYGAQYNACTVDAINTWYKRPDIPIGMNTTFGLGNPAWWASEPCLKCVNDMKNALSSIPDVQKVYRRVLAAQPDSSVVFVSIGPKTDLANLLATPADTISPLTGLQLIAKKVKFVSDMGGDYPSGAEYNFIMDGKAVQTYVDSWPVPKVFIG